MKRQTPKDGQICIIEFDDGERQYAVWNNNYSIYGSGGHFQLGNGGMVGIPVDIAGWIGTHWLVSETPEIAIGGSIGQYHSTTQEH